MDELPDRISETFQDSIVFITGATGFIGSVLVEKMLRTTEVKRLYILVRRKRGKTPSERLQDMFNDNLFSVLKNLKPDAIKKCVAILGDVSEIDLGISQQERNVLINEVNFIIHSAATTRFDDSLKTSVILNTRGTKFMLELAEECLQLKLFVHISTAYAFPNEKIIYAKPYDPPANPHDVLSSINWINEDIIHSSTKRILGDIPNTYTFSKALAEALVYEKMGKIPIVILRPSIVIPTLDEPFPGWCNNIKSPIGVSVGCITGVIRSLYMDAKSHANFIPVDYVVNGILVICSDYKTMRESPKIYNLCTPDDDFQITFEDIISTSCEIANEIPFTYTMWYPNGTVTGNRLVHNINIVLFQLLPAMFIDFFCILLGLKPLLYKIQIRVRKALEVFEYYFTKSWNFCTEDSVNRREKMNAREKQIYRLKSGKVDAKEYLKHCMWYIRRHIFKEPDDTLARARRNLKIMYAVDLIAKVLLLSALLYYFYTFFLEPVLSPRKVA